MTHCSTPLSYLSLVIHISTQFMLCKHDFVRFVSTKSTYSQLLLYRNRRDLIIRVSTSSWLQRAKALVFLWMLHSTFFKNLSSIFGIFLNYILDRYLDRQVKFRLVEISTGRLAGQNLDRYPTRPNPTGRPAPVKPDRFHLW